MDAETTPTSTAARSDALARATALAKRASDLRRAQVEVQDLTAREVQVMAKAAASFFEAIPLPEFSTALLPNSARTLRRMRHRILHRTVTTTMTGTMIHAMLLGRDGLLRLFSARTADSRDLLMSLEPGRPLPPTVIRDVVDWTPMLRVDGFRPFEILEKLSVSLDAVEEQIAEAEAKVQVQKQALATGDLKALLPMRGEKRETPQRAATTAPIVIDESPAVIDEPVEMPSEPEVLDDVVAVSAEIVPPPPPAKNPFDLFSAVEKAAATVPVREAEPAPAPPVVSAAPELASRHDFDDEPEEWDDPEPWDEPVPSSQPPQLSAAPRLSLFPVMPPPH